MLQACEILSGTYRIASVSVSISVEVVSSSRKSIREHKIDHDHHVRLTVFHVTQGWGFPPFSTTFRDNAFVTEFPRFIWTLCSEVDRSYVQDLVIVAAMGLFLYLLMVGI